MDNDLPVNESLSAISVAQLMEDLDISEYLLQQPCQRHTGNYQSDIRGWGTGKNIYYRSLVRDTPANTSPTYVAGVLVRYSSLVRDTPAHTSPTYVAGVRVR
jgi:hypothetical protein